MRGQTGYAMIAEREEEPALGEKRLIRGFLMAEGALYALFLTMDLLRLGRAGDPIKFCSIILCAAFCLYWSRLWSWSCYCNAADCHEDFTGLELLAL